jgi:hypothetical protein
VFADDEGGHEANDPQGYDEHRTADILKSPLMNDKDFLSFMAFYKSPSKEADKGKCAAGIEDEE